MRMGTLSLDEQTNVRVVRDVVEGILDGRWSMASAKHWLEEHVPGDVAADEDPATALARRALRVVRARCGGAPRAWVEEELAVLLGPAA